MKFLLIGFITVSAAIVTIYAADEGARLENLYGRTDTNKDGQVTRAEFLGYWKDRFQLRDKDKNGIHSLAECGAAIIKQADADSDGQVSLEEEQAIRIGQFNVLDKNGDGILKLLEMLNKGPRPNPPKSIASKSKDPKPKATKAKADSGSGLDADRATVDALSNLTAAPNVWLADGFESTDDLAAIYFKGLDWQGKHTKVFAWLGLPEDRVGKVPGVVLVHGGGGTAYKEWVKLWNARGYAAIAIAVEGQTDIEDLTNLEKKGNMPWQSHDLPGPKRLAIYRDTNLPIKDQWMYHAVADTILANSLLRSFPDVDAENVGVMGISWGGVITSTVIGLDDRFAFAIPVYGCGNLSTANNRYGRSLGDNETYKQVWDPILRLENAQMPTLWQSWPRDPHFPLDLQASCYAAQPGQHMVSLVPKMGHSHSYAWERPESYAFADSIVKDAKPWCIQQFAILEGDLYEVVFRSTKPLDSAELISTSDKGVTNSRKWLQTPLSKPISSGENWKVTATIPKGSTAWFINVKSDELIVSSDFTEAD